VCKLWFRKTPTPYNFIYMTSEQFNDKYKDYLEEGHYGLGIDIPEFTDWLDKKFQDFIKKPEFTYSQIKAKFGEGRFY